MFKLLKNIYNNIKNLNFTVDNYKNDTVIQSLPIIAFVNKAKKLFEQRQYDAAEEILLEALDMGEDALVYKYLGKINEQRGQFKPAVGYYDKSAYLNPNDKEIWLRLGMCELYSDMFKEAILSFEKANKLNPMNTDIYTGWGMAYMRMKKYSQARDKFNTACQISKYNYTAILLSAVMEMRLEEYSSAEDKLKFLSKVAPNETSNYEYAHLQFIKSDYENAIIYANKALEVNKKMLPAYLLLGETYSVLNEKENVYKTFETAIQNDLDSAILHFEWGKACIRILEFDKAKSEFQKTLDKDSNFKDANIGLALLNAYNEDFSLLEELKEKNASNVYIQEALGLEYLSQNKLDLAAEMFKKALKTDEKQTFNYYNLARTYAKLNQNDKARDYYEKFIEKYPTDLNRLLEYCKWLINISDFNQAQRKLRKAQKLSENNVEIINMLFFTQYTLARENISEYNIREALANAHKAQELGRFDYIEQANELENILKNIQETK